MQSGHVAGVSITPAALAFGGPCRAAAPDGARDSVPAARDPILYLGEVGPDRSRRHPRPMIDLHVLIATPGHADFEPFPWDGKVETTCGPDRIRERTPMLEFLAWSW